RMVHISPLAATTSIWEQGHRYLFMVLAPAELFLAGLIEMASENELQRVAILEEDALFPKAAGAGAAQLAMERGVEVVLHESYRNGTSDFTEFLARVQASNAHVLAMDESGLGDFITVARQMSEQNVHVSMFGTTGGVDAFREALGDTAEHSYGLSAWEH